MAWKNRTFLRHDFKAHLVISGKKNPFARQPLGRLFPRPGSKAGVFCPVRLKKLSVTGSYKDRVSRLYLNTLGFGGSFKILRAYLLPWSECIDVLEASDIKQYRPVDKLFLGIVFDPQFQQPGRP